MSRFEPSPSTVGRWAPGVDALRPGTPAFALPMSIAPHLSLWRLIAEGSSLVFEGFDRRMALRVAVKVLAVRGDANAHARLLREAALYANLDSSSVPRLYDVAELGDGTPYVVMEFVAGQTLAELLAQGPIMPSLACDIANQVLGALAVLHRAGIIHRDIKPTNIILEPADEGRRRARLVDLGVAKSSTFDTAPNRLTQAGSILGTPQYMAPEQFAGAEADGRTDLYAVGLILVEMLAGVCPHASRSFADLIAARMRDELDEAALTRAGIGPGLTRFLRMALARDPEARFSSAEDMQCELHAARADESCLWMQRSSRQPVGAGNQPVGAIATLPPPAISTPQVAVDSAVWGVLPDPPAFDEVRRPPARSGVKALLLGFGLTFAVGGVLVLRAQTRDGTEATAGHEGDLAAVPSAMAMPSAAAGTTAVPLTAPASAAGVGERAPGTAEAAPEQWRSNSLGATSSLEETPADTARLAGQLSKAGAPRPRVQASRRRSERVRRYEREPEAVEAPAGRHASEASVLPDNPY